MRAMVRQRLAGKLGSEESREKKDSEGSYAASLEEIDSSPHYKVED